MKHILYILVILILPLSVAGQLLTSTAMTTTQLVQNVFQAAGSGVTISNITFSGSPASIGYFDGSNTNIGMSEGIILTTGTVSNNGNGPHGPNNSESSGIDNGFPGNTLLTTLSGNPTFNAAVLEFDFETCSDSVSFNYIFASEEWPEYVNLNVNDAFGLFISGPGIAGNQNIARLPNGTQVAINNIHGSGTNVNGNNYGAMNSQYYISNNNGTTIQYDAFTRKLTAKTAVQCNQVYHLTIAIADAGDGIYDSGVFLEANSFNANNPVSVDHQLSVNVFNNEYIMAEGCVSTTIELERTQCNLGSSLTIPISASGTAIEGVDYATLPPNIVFPAGSATTSITFDCFGDGIAEGQETVDIELQITDNCNNQYTETLNLFIQDIDDVDVTIDGGTVICPGEEVQLVANPSGGAPPYTYLWSTGETTQTISVSPTSTQTYSVQVTDDCLGATATAQFEVVVPIIPPLVLNETPDITEICPYIPWTLESNPSGGVAPYTFQWYSNLSPNLGTTQDISVAPSNLQGQVTTYTVIVTDFCGTSTTEDIVYTILSPPITLDMSPDIEICPGDSALISVASTGGYGQHYYNWLHSGETTTSVWVKPPVTTTYTVSVSDECQTFTVEGSTEVAVIKPTANFTTTNDIYFNDFPITFLNLSQNASTYEWDFGDGNTDTYPHPTNTYDEPGLYYITLVAIDDKGCTDTITKPINIEEEWWIYVPNAFTPDGDRSNSTFRASTIGINTFHITIFNRWGQLVFESHDKYFGWDGTYNGTYINDGTYTWKIRFITNSGREKEIVGHVNSLR